MDVCQETPTSTKISYISKPTIDASGPSQPVGPNPCNTEAKSQVKSGKKRMINYSMNSETGHSLGLWEVWITRVNQFWDLYYKGQ